jgi:hypothetical protein
VNKKIFFADFFCCTNNYSATAYFSIGFLNYPTGIKKIQCRLPKIMLDFFGKSMRGCTH